MPHKKETQFTWLTPRSQTAGATDTVHAAFKLLQAVNAGMPHFWKPVVARGYIPTRLQPSFRRLMASCLAADALPGGTGSDVAAAAPELEAGPGVGAPPTGACTPAMASVQTVSHTADGSHLDALVPLRPSSAASGTAFVLAACVERLKAPGPAVPLHFSAGRQTVFRVASFVRSLCEPIRKDCQQSGLERGLRSRCLARPSLTWNVCRQRGGRRARRPSAQRTGQRDEPAAAGRQHHQGTPLARQERSIAGSVNASGLAGTTPQLVGHAGHCQEQPGAHRYESLTQLHRTIQDVVTGAHRLAICGWRPRTCDWKAEYRDYAGLQAMVPPSSLPQTVPAAALLHHRLLAPSGMPTVAPSLLPQQHLPAGRPAVAERRFVMTPEAGAKAPNKLFTQSAPAGQSAEGWKISIVFRGISQPLSNPS